MSDQPYMTIVGDVMPGRRVTDSIRARGLAQSARAVRALLRGRVGVGNLECPLYDAGPDSPFKPTGAPNLHAPVEMAGWLKDAGMEVLCLANNHTLDCGERGLSSTLEALADAGLRWVGAGRNYDEAIAPAIVDTPGGPVALLGFGNGPAATRSAPGVAPFRTASLLEALGRVPAGVAGTIVLMHAGIEFLPWPESSVRDFAAEALRAGASLVIGGHPHCLRGVARYERGTVYYGVGDFVMDTAKPELLEAHVRRTALTRMGYAIADPLICRQGMAVDVSVDGSGQLQASHRPLFVGEDFLPVEGTPAQRSQWQERVDALSADLQGHSAALGQVRRIERAYRATFGSGRRLGDWLMLPLRARPRHLRAILRRLVGDKASAAAAKGS